MTEKLIYIIAEETKNAIITLEMCDSLHEAFDTYNSFFENIENVKEDAFLTIKSVPYREFKLLIKEHNLIEIFSAECLKRVNPFKLNNIDDLER